MIFDVFLHIEYGGMHFICIVRKHLHLFFKYNC